MKQKIRTENVNIQTADPKANASVFLFFPTAHFLKTIFANAQMAHLVCPIQKPTLRKTKRAIFCQRSTKPIEHYK